MNLTRPLASKIEPLVNVPVLNIDEDGSVHDDFVQLELEFCNSGVVVTAERWLDVYEEFSVFESPTERVGWLELPGAGFVPPEKQCGVAQPTIPIPSWVPDGAYRLRSLNVYAANPVRDVPVEYVTEQFELDRDSDG